MVGMIGSTRWMETKTWSVCAAVGVVGGTVSGGGRQLSVLR